MAFHLKVPVVPASFFGMVLGLSGLANAWRAAHQVWGLPAWTGEALVALSTTVWMIGWRPFRLKRWMFQCLSDGAVSLLD